jgi:hypothetical protein
MHSSSVVTCEVRAAAVSFWAALAGVAMRKLWLSAMTSTHVAAINDHVLSVISGASSILLDMTCWLTEPRLPDQALAVLWEKTGGRE